MLNNRLKSPRKSFRCLRPSGFASPHSFFFLILFSFFFFFLFTSREQAIKRRNLRAVPRRFIQEWLYCRKLSNSQSNNDAARNLPCTRHANKGSVCVPSLRPTPLAVIVKNDTWVHLSSTNTFSSFFSFDLMHWFEKHTVINRWNWQFIYMHIAFFNERRKIKNAYSYTPGKSHTPVYCINGLTSNIFLFPLLRGPCVFQSQCVLFNKYIFGTWTRGRPNWFM